MITVKLSTSIQTIDKLNEMIDQGHKTVTIETGVLERLLIDHSNMFKALHGISTVKVEEPKR